MKKQLIPIILTFLFYQGFSQNIKYGIGAGVNTSSLISDQSYIENFKYKTGFQINTIVEYSFNDNMRIRVEPGFANRGTVENYNSTSDSKININYFTAPILFNYSPFNRLSILIGPEVAYRLTKEFKIDNPRSLKYFIDNKIDFGINAGLSYQLLNNIDLHFRYNRGFITTLNENMEFYDDNGIIEEKAKIYNQGFSISLTYMIK